MTQDRRQSAEGRWDGSPGDLAGRLTTAASRAEAPTRRGRENRALRRRLDERPRHAVSPRPHPFLRGVGALVVGLLAFGVAGGVFAFNELQGNIEQQDVSALLGENRPTVPADPGAGRPLNILVMGSDVRSGENAAFGADITGMRSDTTLLVHISAARDRAEIVSIPRDLLVDIPGCPLPEGGTSRAQGEAMFNSAFSTGGQTGDVAHAAACTIRTVEEMSGLFIDDYVVVDFTGFITMVDALGGIPMCIPEDMYSKEAELDLEAGYQTLNGWDALAFARARKNVGDGSDISRIGRQQELLGAMVRQMLSKNLLTDLPALYQFLDAGTNSLTAGPMVGQLSNMVGLANSLRAIPAGGVSFVTLPFDWAGPRVRPNEDSAALWGALVADRPIAPAPAPEETTAPTAGATSSPTDGADPTGSPEPAATASATPTPTEQPWDVLTGADQEAACG